MVQERNSRRCCTAAALLAALAAGAGCPSVNPAAEGQARFLRAWDRPYTGTDNTQRLEGAFVTGDPGLAEDAVTNESLMRLPTPPF
ncbi:MAG: hypothetical protein KatS3mg102_0119 [Planctomycetota bacterium]|nr:MAG: hypothetical protein KatS3mg102_0119 [Planctomycetota bacterium]